MSEFTHDPVEQDLRAHLAREEQAHRAYVARLDALRHSQPDVMEALREATYRQENELQPAFLAYKKSDDAALGKALRELMDLELAGMAEED